MRQYVWLAAFGPYLILAAYAVAAYVASPGAASVLENVGLGLALVFAAINIAFMVHIFFERPEIEKRRTLLAALLLQYPFVIATFFLIPLLRK